MNLRELVIERILWAVSEEELSAHYHTTEDELTNLSDADLLDLYDDVTFDFAE